MPRDKVKKSIYNKQYYNLNKDEIDTKRKEWDLANKAKIAEQKRLNYQLNKDKIREQQRAWQLANKDIIKANQRLRMGDDILYKLKTNIKNLIGNSLRKNNYSKLSKTEQILGCSYSEFKSYLENKFEPWMSWDNRGLYNGELNYGWDIDHIIPLSTATCEADIIRLNHYTNLQPLCSYTNRYIKKHVHICVHQSI